MVEPAHLDMSADVRRLTSVRPMGRICAIRSGLITVEGMTHHAALGDWLEIASRSGIIRAEVIDLRAEGVIALVDGIGEGLRLDDAVVCVGPPQLRPSDAWLGRMIDPFGQALDGAPLRRGTLARSVRGEDGFRHRRPMGARLTTGLAVFDTLLPLARGQRLGLFSGAGVGKSTLLGQLAQGVQADVIVAVLVGERNREIREFADRVLTPEVRARTVLVVAPADAPPLTRRQALLSATTIAEHFRDHGRHVLLLADSITRFAEAHREVALASGELPALKGHPPSMVQWITKVAERAGPGGNEPHNGDITAIFSVLVSGGDLDEPVADVLRATLDGHVILAREISERGRFPAVDVVRSVSRSLPDAAQGSELALITRARRLLAAYDRAATLVQSGLYSPGADPELDAAVALWPRLDAFCGEAIAAGPEAAFARLAAILRNAGASSNT